MTREQIRRHLEFYRDLGIEQIYLPRAPQQSVSASPAVAASAPIDVLPALSPEDDTLDAIRLDIGDCKRCRLSEGRLNIVFRLR